jgi:PAS domain S-box-containing protein
MNEVVPPGGLAGDNLRPQIDTDHSSGIYNAAPSPATHSMPSEATQCSADAEHEFLAGGGEMGERTRAMDWSRTLAGPVDEWPHSLKTAVSICLGSGHPMVVWWGIPAYTQFYNDAYISFLGRAKHPGYLGRSARDCWSEIWPIIGPMLDSVYQTGQATWSEDLLLVLSRNLPQEEAYFTFSYSPIRNDDGAIGGIFCACNETTPRVIGERRLRTLRDLNRVEAEAKTADAACKVAARTLAENRGDIPFALVYLLASDSDHAVLIATTALEARGPGAPSRIDLKNDVPETSSAWPLRRVLATGAAQSVQDLSARFGTLPGGLWPESPEAALIVPIPAPGQTRPAGFLVCGLSPRQVIDTDYKSFFDLVAGHIGTSIANARAYEEERKRAEALAEIDRAKTAFFSNVSHEFRTPLTLMLGPLEDVLAERDGPMPEGHRQRLAMAQRNGLRLLKLVNSLLDFSRIEAGRIEASYELTDIATYTGELASVFRSAIEKAGLRFVIDCEPIAAPTYVDRDMWEKIVLNLLSNALKFTLAGEIGIRLTQADRNIVLEVSDTGIGIPKSEQPRLFEHFHRVRGAEGRTHEGSGIGLALVQELVRLHHGAVVAASEPGKGSTFAVRIPTGREHLPIERINANRALAPTGLGANPYVEEALRWLPGRDEELALPGVMMEKSVAPASLRAAPGEHQRVLIADDNADMRDYLRRLLGERYEVTVAADGNAALAAVRRQRPDLVLSDVMMPGLDGFALLREIRRDAALRDIPVVLLSARAGEEASVEGLEAGADDYLTKPFSARELLARIRANLEMARIRQKAAQRERALRSEADELRARLGVLLQQMPAGVLMADAEGRIIFANEQAAAVLKHPIIFADALSQHRAYRAVHADGRPYEPEEYPLVRSVLGEIVRDEEQEYILGDGTRATLLASASPIRSANGTIIAAIVTFVDITARKRAETALRESEELFRNFAETMPQLAWTARADGSINWYNRRWYEYTGTTSEQMEGWGWQAVHDSEELPRVLERWRASLASGDPFEMVYPLRGADGVFRPFLTRATPMRDRDGRALRWIGTSTDVTAQREAEDTLRRLNEVLEKRVAERTAALAASENRFRLLVEGVVDYAIFMLDRQGCVANWNTGARRLKGYAAAEIVGKHFSCLYTEEDRTKGVPQRALDTAARVGKVEMEGWRVRKDGMRFWANVVIDAIRDDKGELVGFAKVTRDMTERRAVEEQLRQSQKMEAIGQLTGGVAHDFNNLLTVIFGNLETLLLRHLPAGTTDARRLVEGALRGATRGAALTERLLAFSRRQPLEPKPLNVNKLVSSASELLRRTLGERIAIETVLAGGVWWVHADPTQLESALLNLAVNARDAMPEGGRLTLETANTHLDEAYAAAHGDLTPGQYVMLAVTDTGSGMSKDTIARVFEPFFTTKAIGHGTGLGLSQVYGYIKQSDGHVKIYSEPGQGTSVKLYLPRLATGPEETESVDQRPRIPTSLPGETILVVEDDDDVRAPSIEMLRELGYRVIGAPDGASALRALAEEPSVHLLFTDLGLPAASMAGSLPKKRAVVIRDCACCTPPATRAMPSCIKAGSTPASSW